MDLRMLLGAGALLLAAVAAPGSRPAAPRGSLQLPLVERMRAATVLIGVNDPKTGRLRATGTGFLISPRGDVVTAAHVVTNPGQLSLLVRSGQPGAKRVRAVLARIDHTTDLALLKTDLVHNEYLALGDSAVVRETGRVLTAGFPLGEELDTSGTGPAPSFRTGQVTSLRRTRFGGLVWLEISSDAEAGSSGSPVVDASGAVVGVLDQIGGRSTVLAIPSRRLVTFAGDAARIAAAHRATLDRWKANPVEQAQTLMESNQFTRARQLLQPLLTDAPSSPRLVELRATLADHLGELEPAISAYELLLRVAPNDARASYWSERAAQLRRYRGDGNPRNNLAISTPLRQELSVIDAGTGAVLERLPDAVFSPFFRYRSDGRYAFTRRDKSLAAVDLVIPQEARHLRRSMPEAGTPDWVSASADGERVVAAFSPYGRGVRTSSIAVYQGPELRQRACFNFDEAFPAGYVTPDGASAYLFPSSRSEEIDLRMVRVRRLDLKTGRLSVLPNDTPPLYWLTFISQPAAAYGIRFDNQLMRVDPETGAATELPVQEVMDLAPGPEPGQLLVGGRELLVWDVGTDRAAARYALPFKAFQVGTTPDGAYLFAADATRDRVLLLERRTGASREINLSPASTGGAGTLKLLSPVLRASDRQAVEKSKG